MGKPQNDLGCRTDVLDGCPKVEGMMMLVRSIGSTGYCSRRDWFKGRCRGDGLCDELRVPAFGNRAW